MQLMILALQMVLLLHGISNSEIFYKKAFPTEGFFYAVMC